jgi:Bacteriophage related domain of unknown function
MSTSIEAKIIDGLLRRFGTITLPSGCGVAYPNDPYDPDGTNPYVRLTIAKNQPISGRLSGGKEPIRMGLLLATVCYPVNTGINNGSELAGTIRDTFAFGTKWTEQSVEIRIVQEPMVQGDAVVGAYSEIPVVIPWHVYP